MDQGGRKQTDSDPFTCHDRSEISPNQSFLVKTKKTFKKKTSDIIYVKYKDDNIPVLCVFLFKNTSDL